MFNIKWAMSCPLLISIFSFPAFSDNGSEIPSADLNSLDRSRSEFQDKRVFDVGAKVNVYLDYNSFITEGFTTINPFLTQKDMEASVRIATERWMQLSGVNLKVKYAGVRNGVSASTNEIVVKAARYTKFKYAVASADDIGSKKCNITFYSKRQDAKGNLIEDIKWAGVFHFHKYPANSAFIFNILMHEMGHCFGLGHNNYIINGAQGKSTRLTVMSATHVPVHNSFGPYREDIEDMHALYGIAPNTSLEVSRSTDDGVSWSVISNDLGRIRTVSTLAPVVNRDNDRIIMFYQTPQGRPAFVMGDKNASTWDPNSNKQFQYENSIYGVSGSGYGNEYMLAWVDPYDEHRIKIFYTNDGGAFWKNLGNPGIKAGARPSIRKASANTWILTYVHLDDNQYSDKNGIIYSIISVTDGRNWSTPIELANSNHFRTVNAVSVTSYGRNNIRIGFVPSSASNSSWNFKAANFNASISSDNIFSGNYSTSDLIYGPPNSDITFTRNDDVWVLAYKQAVTGKIQSCKKENSNFTCYNYGSTYKYLEPALTAKTNSNWIYMIKEK
jgi:predicted Zn-dependent protease